GALAAKLQAVGVATVMDFVRLPRTTVRKFGGVVLERTWLELQGEVCIPLVETPPKRQQIVRSRSFGELITDKESVLSAVSVHVASAARILRKEGTETTRLTVQFQSDPFRMDDPQYYASPTFEFDRPTSDTLLLTHTACSLVECAWRAGIKYRRAGVIV
ncbi:DNA polymerase V subunit UmuC, partial [gut metagenome]